MSDKPRPPMAEAVVKLTTAGTDAEPVNVHELHPRFSEPRIIKANVEGGSLINVGGMVEIMRRGETKQARQAYRLFLIEYRALAGRPLTNDEREWQAFRAAFARLGTTLLDPVPLSDIEGKHA